MPKDSINTEAMRPRFSRLCTNRSRSGRRSAVAGVSQQGCEGSKCRTSGMDSVFIRWRVRGWIPRAAPAPRDRWALAVAREVMSSGQSVWKTPLMIRRWLPTPRARNLREVRSASLSAANCGRLTKKSVVAEPSPNEWTVASQMALADGHSPRAWNRHCALQGYRPRQRAGCLQRDGCGTNCRCKESEWMVFSFRCLFDS